MKKHIALIASCAGLALATSPALAQSIDYTTMQEMFGEPVTTSATGQPQRISDVPLTMEIITAEDIRRSGAVDIPEILRQVNGVTVMQGSTHGYDVSVRGYNQGYSPRLLVLVNGRQVYLDYYGLTAWSTIPVQLEEIQQIEVVKGPNTALFGFNAVSGVINIITYNPLYDDQSSVGVTVGTQNYHRGHYVQSFKLSDKLGVRLSGRTSRSDSFEGGVNSTKTLTNINGDKLLLDPKQDALNLDAMYQVTNASQVRLELSQSKVEQGDYVGSGLISGSLYTTESAKLSYEVDAGDYGLIKANIYKNSVDWDTIPDPFTPTYSLLTNNVVVAQLEDTIQLNPSHILRLQAEYRDNDFSANIVVSSDAEVSYKVYAGSAMWNWRMNDDWSWTNAVRLDHLSLERSGSFLAGNDQTNDDFDRDITELSYNSGLVWTPTDEDTIRISTARGIEVPSLLEFGIEVDAGGTIFRGSPNLDPAIITSYELAWDKRLQFIDDGIFKSALFYQKTEDVKALGAEFSGGFAFLDPNNIGDSDTYGLELSLGGAMNENFDWNVGYIYQKVNDDLDNKAAPGLSGDLSVGKEYEESTPQHQVQLKLGYQKNAWEADALAYYISDIKLRGEASNIDGTLPFVDISGHVGLNARVAYTFDNDVTLALHGMNLQSSETQTTPIPDIERRVFLSLSKKF